MATKSSQLIGPPGYRYNYEILIKNVALALPGAVKIFVVIKRGMIFDSVIPSGRHKADRDQVEADCRQTEHRRKV